MTTSDFPFGTRVLAEDVQIVPGPNVLTLDLGTRRVVTELRVDGEPLPATEPDKSTTYVYLVATETGAEQKIAGLRYTLAMPDGSYGRSGPTGDLDFAGFPGSYDVVYRDAGSNAQAENPASAVPPWADQPCCAASRRERAPTQG